MAIIGASLYQQQFLQLEEKFMISLETRTLRDIIRQWKNGMMKQQNTIRKDN